MTRWIGFWAYPLRHRGSPKLGCQIPISKESLLKLVFSISQERSDLVRASRATTDKDLLSSFFARRLKIGNMKAEVISSGNHRCSFFSTHNLPPHLFNTILNTF
jgi:hypothetical protein